MAENDEEIISRVLSGNRDDYALLVDRYKDKVFAMVIGIIKNRELAQEVAQDVFVKAYVSLKKFRKEATFSTWIYRISYNTAISETRKSSYKNVLLDENYMAETIENSKEDSEEKEESHKQLTRAIALLKTDEKFILELYYFEDKAINDISCITGLGKSNVKIKLHRLRNKLRKLIEENNEKELLLY
jgi:RNA polymerase sigma-70 factor (ECF subfamily)